MENRSRLLCSRQGVWPVRRLSLGLALGIQIVLTHGNAMVTVQWRDNADNETGFRVERAADGSQFVPVATLPRDRTSYEDHSVTSGLRYWYRVAAFNAGGDSEFSPVVTGIAPGGPVAGPNTAPTISAFSDRTTVVGQAPGVIGFSIGDAESPALDLVVIGNTSNPALVPRENVRFGGSGTNRTLTVTPLANATGWTTIWVKVSDGELSAVSSFVLVVAAADAPAGGARLSNLSARGRSAPADPLILGFVVSGPSPKRVLVRAIGPTLAQPPFLVPGVLPDPRLALMKWQDSRYEPSLANSDWGSGALTASVRAASTAAGAFTLPETSRDAALIAEVQSGQYTAVVDDESGGGGVSLVELYEAGGNAGGRFANLSTRATVGVGGEVLIIGFVIEGPGTMRVLLRAVGPSLGAAPFSVPGVLADPELLLFRQEPGGDSVLVYHQNDWATDPGASETAAASARVGAFGIPPTSLDAAALLTLGPGVYTAVVRGLEGATGTALAEFYDATEPR